MVKVARRSCGQCLWIAGFGRSRERVILKAADNRGFWWKPLLADRDQIAKKIVFVIGLQAALFDDGTTILYDPLGQRFAEQKPSANYARVYAYGASGAREVTVDGLTGNILSAEVLAGSQSIANYTVATDSYEYRFQNQVGTDMARLTPGQGVSILRSTPFGENWPVTGSDDDPGHFADLDLGQTSMPAGSDYYQHATFRDYSTVTGQWLSPDPFDGSYDYRDPQSLNRYAYVANNPLSFTDPLGLREAFSDSIDVYGGDDWGGFLFSLWGWGAFGGGGGWATPMLIGEPPVRLPPIAPIKKKTPCDYAKGAPAPKVYAAAGRLAAVGRLSALVPAAVAASFVRNGPLDAGGIFYSGDRGGARPYANYAFGVTGAAAGLSLTDTLRAANAFGIRSTYSGQVMDPNYRNIPADNVSNITSGYNDQQHGTTCKTS